jgi:hypothetical protein
MDVHRYEQRLNVLIRRIKSCRDIPGEQEAPEVRGRLLAGAEHFNFP